MECVVLRFLQDVANDLESDVRCRAAEVLVQLVAHCSSEWGTQLLAILNSILQKGLQVASKAIKDKVGGAYGCWWVEFKQGHEGLGGWGLCVLGDGAKWVLPKLRDGCWWVELVWCDLVGG